MAAVALLRALRQAGDPAFLRVLVQSAALASLCFVGLAAVSGWMLHRLMSAHPVLADATALLGGAGALLLALWFFLPVAGALASLFLEPICRAVERRWYPDLPPPAGAGFWAQLADALSLGARLLVASAIGLLAALMLPGAGVLIGLAIGGWAIGRGLFVAVAMRRMKRSEALWLYRASRLSVLPDGGVLALAGTVPLLNLLVPVIGTAAMVHLVQASGSGRTLSFGARKLVHAAPGASSFESLPGGERGQSERDVAGPA